MAVSLVRPVKLVGAMLFSRLLPRSRTCRLVRVVKTLLGIVVIALLLMSLLSKCRR